MRPVRGCSLGRLAYAAVLLRVDSCVSASSYTHDTDDERTADYHTEEESPHFSEFPQAAKVVFIAIVIALLGVIAFEGFQLFRGPTASESATQEKEDDNQYLDINTLKGDPNDEDDE